MAQSKVISLTIYTGVIGPDDFELDQPIVEIWRNQNDYVTRRMYSPNAKWAQRFLINLTHPRWLLLEPFEYHYAGGYTTITRRV